MTYLNPKALFDQAVHFMTAGNYPAALQNVKILCTSTPGKPEVWHLLAEVQRRAGNTQASEEALKRALALRPRFIAALNQLAQLQRNAGRLEEASHNFRKVLEIEPGNLRALHDLGLVLKTLGHWEEAEQVLRKAAGVAPDNPNVQQNFGSVLRLTGRTEEAIKALRKAVELAPDNPDNHHWLNELLWMQGDETFLESYQTAKKNLPDHPGLSLQLATHLLYAGRLDEAEQELRNALEKAPERFDLRMTLGSVLHEQESWDDALTEFETALVQSPNNTTILDGMGDLVLGMGDAERGLEIYEQLLRYEPDNIAFWANIATAYRMLNRDEYHWLYDLDNLLFAGKIDVPTGYRDLAEFNEELLHDLEKWHFDKQHPLHQSVKGGTQTADNLFNVDQHSIQLLKKAMLDQIHSFDATLKPDPTHPTLKNIPREVMFSGSWSIRNPVGGFHLNHHHIEGWYSGPYYVSLPDVIRADDPEKQGWVTFGQPGFKAREPLEPDLYVQPQEGMMVLFPSYMWHGTIPFYGTDQYRVTVAQDHIGI
jgi:tetratricopeptide (TPR) repeat protein